jgi:hypothetical protein
VATSAQRVVYLLSHIRLGGASIDHGGHHPRMTSTAQTGVGSHFMRRAAFRDLMR